MTYFRIGYIYLITNLINGKQYVGQTVTTVDRRWNIHLKSAECGMSTVLARAIRKYGADNFKVEELLQCMEPTLNTAECRFIKDLYTLTPNGYNMTEGGSGVRLTKAQLKRKAARRVGVPLSEYHRSRISESLIGKVHSAEWCRNSSEAQ